MTVNLSMLAGAGAQFFDNNGIPLVGGLVYTYAAGTTTPQAAYTTSAGSIAHANPIVLDSSGRVPTGGEIWLTDAVAYKFVLKTSGAITIGTYDNITGNSSGIYAAFAASSGSSLIGYLPGGTSAVATTVQTKLRTISVSVIDFGADTTGVSSSSAAFTNANNTSNQVVISKGTYLISTSVTFTVPVFMEYGAVITVPNGVTLTFNGTFNAGVYQCFNCTGTGAVVFLPTKTAEGYSEWWGAVVDSNDSGVATKNVAAINAALIALTKVQLMPADYWTDARLYMGLPWKELNGYGENFTGSTSNLVTRVLCTSATADVIQVGPDTYPGSVNDLYQGNKVSNIYFTRYVGPLVSSSCNTIKNQYTLKALFTNVQAAEGIYSWQFYGTVGGMLNRCRAFRSVAGTGGTDLWYGFYVNGAAVLAGLNSGNASLYLNYCNASPGLVLTTSVGFYIDQRLTDVFLESPETTGCATGIEVLGNASNSSYNYENGDVQIKNPIVDNFTYAGIWFKNMNKFGSAEVTAGYYGPAAGARAAVAIDSCTGAIRISGGQAIMVLATTGSGVSIANSNGVIIDRMIIMEAWVSGIDYDTCNYCEFKPVVKNYSTTMTGAVIRGFNTNTRNTVAPIAYGANVVFPLGVQFASTGNGYCEIDCTGLNSASITGGSGNKLVINGSQVTTTGLSGTNFVTGVMA